MLKRQEPGRKDRKNVCSEKMNWRKSARDEQDDMIASTGTAVWVYLAP